MRRVAAAGFKAVPTGIEHGTITVVVDGTPVRGDDAARGHRDLRAPRQGRLRTRLAARRRAPRFHHECALGRALTARVLRLCRRARRPRGAARALHRRSGKRGSPRTICASCGSFASTLPTVMAHPTRRGSHACIAARAGLETLSRERVRMETVQAPGRDARGADARGDDRNRPARGGARRRAAARRALPTWSSSRRRSSLPPDPVRRLGALGVSVVEDAERLRERLRLANTEYERLVSMARRLVANLLAWEERAGRALLYRLGPEKFTDRVLLAWSRSPQGVADARWHALATPAGRAGARRRFRCARPIFSRAACRRGRALGAALRAAEAAWIAADFPRDAAALAAIADAAARGR